SASTLPSSLISLSFISPGKCPKVAAKSLSLSCHIPSKSQSKRTLMGWPINHLLPGSSSFPPYNSTISFLLVWKTRSVVQRNPPGVLASKFTEDTENSNPLFLVEPTFSSTLLNPEVGGNCLFINKSV